MAWFIPSPFLDRPWRMVGAWCHRPGNRALGKGIVLAVALGAVSCRPQASTSAVVMAWESFPTTFDPRFGQDQASQRLLSLTHQGLLKRGADLSLVADGCLEWRWVEPGRELAFAFPSDTLAQQLGARWFWFQPHRPLRAEDARATLENLCDPATASPKGGVLRTNLERLWLNPKGDRIWLHLRLVNPDPGYPANLVRGALGLVAQDAPTQGTGPYTRTETIPEQRILLVPKHGHPDFATLRGIPLPLDCRLMADANTRLLALRHGSVQAALSNLPPDLLREGQGFAIHGFPGANLEYVAFQCDHPVLRDPRVRRALSLALDGETLAQGLMQGRARPACGFYPPELPWGMPLEKTLPLPARRDQAQRLLDDAGYKVGPKGWRFTVTLSATPEAQSRMKALALQAQWQTVGVRLRVVTREFGTLLSEVAAGRFEVVSLRWVGAPDPAMLYQVFHSRMQPPAGFNRGRYADAETDRLLDEARLAASPDARHAATRAAQRRIRDQAPYAFLWWPDQVAALAPGLSLDLNAVGDFTALWRTSRP